MNLWTRMLFLLAVASSLSVRNRQPWRTTKNRKHQERRDPFSLLDAGSCNVDVVCYLPCDNSVYQIINKVCASRKGCQCHVMVFKSSWSERCNCRKGSFVSTSNPSTPSTTILTAEAEMLVGPTVTSWTCEIIGIVCTVVAFFLGVIVSLAVMFFRRKKANGQHEEPSSKNGVSELCAQLKEASDHREGRNTYYLRKEPDTSNGIRTVINSQTSPDVLPNEEDFDGGVYCHLGVVSEAETRETTCLKPPDHGKSFSAPPAHSQQVDVSQHLPSHDINVYSSINKTLHVPQERSVSLPPLEPHFDDADEHIRFDCHGDQDNAANSSADDTCEHVQCPRLMDEKPVSSSYELAQVVTDG